MFSEAYIWSTLETFHQIIVFVMDSEAVKTEKCSTFLKSQATVLQWIKMEASPFLSGKLLLSFGWEEKGN